VVLSEELRRDVGGTRLGGIGRNRQTQGQFIGRSGGKVVELCGFPLGGTAGIVKGSWGNGKDSLLCGGIARTSLHRGIVVDPCGKQVEHVQVELKHIKSH